MSGARPSRQFGVTFQGRVRDWMLKTFSEDKIKSRRERNFRFLEEALELVQARGMTQAEALEQLHWTYNRPPGEPRQEVGGVLVTLAALCQSARLDMMQAGEDELARCWKNIDKIREKQASKPGRITGGCS